MKEQILEYFKDINHAYNDCTRYDTLKRMLGELEQDLKTDVLDKIRAEIEEQKGNRCFDDDDMCIYRTGLNDAIGIIDKHME